MKVKNPLIFEGFLKMLTVMLTKMIQNHTKPAKKSLKLYKVFTTCEKNGVGGTPAAGAPFAPPPPISPLA